MPNYLDMPTVLAAHLMRDFCGDESKARIEATYLWRNAVGTGRQHRWYSVMWLLNQRHLAKPAELPA